MGTIKTIKPHSFILSKDIKTLGNGKQISFIWVDRTINNLLKRAMEDL